MLWIKSNNNYRHRKNNLRLLNVLEGDEKDLFLMICSFMPSYLVKTLAEKWNLKLKEEDFEKTHRIGPAKDTSKYSHAIIFKLHHF